MPLHTTCPNCGGPVELQDDESKVDCRYCRATVHRPSEGIQNQEELIQKAFLACNNLDFESAERLFDQISASDPNCIQALWGRVRCRYGIQTLDEDVTNKRYLICNRFIDESVLRNPDYLRLMELTSGKNKRLYQTYANLVDQMRREYKKLRDAGEEFDVFLCYKETERYEDLESGELKSRPSQDAVWVRKIYAHLCEMVNKDKDLRKKLGRDAKIFYAPVTLKTTNAVDQYAATIAYALMTSRVVLVLGSRREYYESPWVRSEWTKAQKYIDSGRNRIIIPIWRPSDAQMVNLAELLPSDLSSKQAFRVSEEDMQNDLQPVAGKIKYQLGTLDRMDPYRRNPFEIQAERLEKELQEKTGELQHYHSLYNTSQDQLETKSKQYEALLLEKLRLESESSLTYPELEALRKDKEKYETFLSEKSQLTQKIEKLSKEAEYNEFFIRKLTNDNVNLEKKYDTAKKEAEDALKSIQQKEAELAAARTKLKELENIKADLIQARADEEQAKKRAEAALKLSENEKAKAIAAQKAADIENSKAEASQKEAEREKAKAEAAQKAADIEKAKAGDILVEFAKAKERIAELETALLGIRQQQRNAPAPSEPAIQLSQYGFCYTDERKCKTFKYGPDLHSEENVDGKKIDSLFIHLRNNGSKPSRVNASIRKPDGTQLPFAPSNLVLRPHSGCEMILPFSGSVSQWCGVFPLIINDKEVGTLTLHGRT